MPLPNEPHSTTAFRLNRNSPLVQPTNWAVSGLLGKRPEAGRLFSQEQSGLGGRKGRSPLWPCMPAGSATAAQGLFQLCVLRLGFLQDGDVGVGVFPEREEILIGGVGFGEGVLL